MNKDFFYKYKFEEYQVAKNISDKLISKNHQIKSPKDLYPEYYFSDSLAFHRPGVNIGALLFFYRQVLVYVPQISKKDFPNRYGINYETFIDLCKPIANGLPAFILPILNHPKHYANKHIKYELKELLELKPPTWERWHKVLEITGGTKWFDLADQKLNYKDMYSFSNFRKYWKRKLGTSNESAVSKEIKQQIKNNFTNLCLIGLEDKALEIADLSHKQPDLAINDLMYSSEIFAYPKIIGANGNANVMAKSKIEDYKKSNSANIINSLRKKGVDSNVIKAIAEGIEFNNIPKVFRLSFLLKWHQDQWSQLAKDFYSKLLEELGKDSPDENITYNSIQEILKLLKEFCKKTEVDEKVISNKINDRNRKVSWMTLGLSTLFGLGGLFGSNLLSFFTSTSTGLIGITSQSHEYKILSSMFNRHYKVDMPPDLIHRFMNLNNFRKKYTELKFEERFKGLKDIYASSNVARNIWWD